MRAWHLDECNGPESYHLVDVPEPEPAPGEIRVALKISALNHLDLWVSRGLPAPHHFPHVAGGDGAGIVDAVGEDVEGISVGDEVILNPSLSCGQCAQCQKGDIVFCRAFGILGEHHPGTLVDKIVIPARNAFPKPANVSWEVAGSFALATGTAYRMLRRARLSEGERLLIVGIGGGVSSAALSIGKALGADVYVTSRSQDKIQWAVDHGASGGFLSDGEFAKDLKTAGGSVDVVFENVGPATWNQSIRSLKPGGRLVTCGSTTGPKVEVTVPVLFFKQLELIGSSMFTDQEFTELLAMLADGSVTPEVSKVFDFEDLPSALTYLDNAEQLGKVALSR